MSATSETRIEAPSDAQSNQTSPKSRDIHQNFAKPPYFKSLSNILKQLETHPTFHFTKGCIFPDDKSFTGFTIFIFAPKGVTGDALKIIKA